MNKLRKVAKTGLLLNKNYLSLGRKAWTNPDNLPGFKECQEACDSITWDDCIKAVGYNPAYIFDQPIATHVLYEMQNLRIMLIFFGGGCSMPIHDHEGMIVFSKCIKGSVGVNYWDLKHHDSFCDQVRNHDFGKIKREGAPVNYHGGYDINEGHLDIVRPYQNNIHCFNPRTDSVIFDLILNDYDSNRPYKEFIRKSDDLLELDSVNRIAI